jgi:hypothetical protein
VIDTVAADGGLSLIDIPQNPVDLDFAATIPAGAQFVVLDDGFGAEMQAGLDALFTLLPLFTEGMDGAGDTDTPPTDPTSPFGEGFGLEELNADTVNLLFAFMTGLDLNADVLDWMTGDYAFFLRLAAGEDEMTPALDLVFVTESDDPDAAANMITALSTSSLFAEGDAELEEIAGGQALVLPLGDLMGSMFDDGMGGDAMTDAPEMDFLLAAGADVFAAGTRTGVAFTLDPSGDSLAGDAAFQYAAENLFLEDTVTVWFINAGALAQALPMLAEMDMDMGDMQDFLTFANLIESATITGRYEADGTAITRLTLTLADD